MDRYALIVEAMVLMARQTIRDAIFRDGPETEPPDEMYWQALSIANTLGERDAKAQFVDPTLTLRVPFSDPDLARQYEYAHNMVLDELAMDACHPGNSSGHVLYCPKGCNVLHTTLGYSECGACGALMTSGNEDQFYDALIAAGQCA